MPTIIRVKFRREGYDDGRRVPAYREDLDLDQLTPRARALAEALHLSMHPLNMTFVGDVLQECDATNAELATAPPARAAALGYTIRNPDARAQRVAHYQFPKATDVRPTPVWLEEQARAMPLDWYPIGVRHQPRVPSWEAGRDDRYLTRDGVLARLRGTRAEIGVQGWDTLRGTGVLPPDRYVQGRPQWRPETVDAFAARPRELWRVSRVAGFLGLATPAAGGAQMRRWGIPAEGREPGRAGENLYPADLVQAAHAHRPGRGTRTDLHRP